jgi:hypothetical protein
VTDSDHAVPDLSDSWLDPDEPDPLLAAWRRNVGPPVALDLAPPLDRAPAAIDVLCWNLAIGTARLGEVLDAVREARTPGPDGDHVPIVVLAQEAYRGGSVVPAERAADDRHAHGGRLAMGRRLDIVEVAVERRLSLRYAPSMRNGASRSDRGNAVLADRAISDARAFSLPLLRQRRVAVAVRLAAVPRLTMVSAHLENRTRLSLGLRAAAGLGLHRAAQAQALADGLAHHDGDVLLGADLNTVLGRRDPAYRRLSAAGFREPERDGAWSHTFHGPVRLPLDHVLVGRGGGPLREVRLRRIDENPADRGRSIYGSDHHPLLARALLAEPAASVETPASTAR